MNIYLELYYTSSNKLEEISKLHPYMRENKINKQKYKSYSHAKKYAKEQMIKILDNNDIDIDTILSFTTKTKV